jgi:hypothetical protein
MLHTYDSENVFAEKKSAFLSQTVLFYGKHDIGFQEKRHFFAEIWQK